MQGLVTELVRRRVRVIVLVGVGATTPPESSWQELRASQIPIVFNVFRWANLQSEQLPTLADELVRRLELASSASSVSMRVLRATAR